ncbi:unnamed protein product [Gongylonema pulchrum]|uniref:Glycine-rich cell wall structural protein 1 n=1 Tax=Gongylonema pulchrum TaxID=637853 RepID=A0A183D1G3_9BILA|nr:unnamed protein product [Gongylonema pulchrum]
MQIRICKTRLAVTEPCWLVRKAYFCEETQGRGCRSQAAVGGPGSVAGAGVGGPGSVHSQSGAPANAVTGGNQGNGPGNGSTGNSASGGQEEASEISKIKQSLFDDLKHFGAKEESSGEGYFS